MFRNILSNIEGISVYPIFSLVVFVLFFTSLAIWVIKADKKYISHMEKLPFDTEN